MPSPMGIGQEEDGAPETGQSEGQGMGRQKIEIFREVKLLYMIL